MSKKTVFYLWLKRMNSTKRDERMSQIAKTLAFRGLRSEVIKGAFRMLSLNCYVKLKRLEQSEIDYWLSKRKSNEKRKVGTDDDDDDASQLKVKQSCSKSKSARLSLTIDKSIEISKDKTLKRKGSVLSDSSKCKKHKLIESNILADVSEVSAKDGKSKKKKEKLKHKRKNKKKKNECQRSREKENIKFNKSENDLNVEKSDNTFEKDAVSLDAAEMQKNTNIVKNSLSLSESKNICIEDKRLQKLGNDSSDVSKIFGIAGHSLNSNIKSNKSLVKFISDECISIKLEEKDDSEVEEESNCFGRVIVRDPKQLFGIPVPPEDSINMNNKSDLSNDNNIGFIESNNDSISKQSETMGKIRVKDLKTLGVGSSNLPLNTLSPSVSSNLLIKQSTSTSCGFTRLAELNQNTSDYESQQITDNLQVIVDNAKKVDTVVNAFASEVISYYNNFSDELSISKISKMSEILHLAICDLKKKESTIENAKLIKSELASKEIVRAERDYKYMLKVRSIEFCSLFYTFIKIPNYNSLSVIILYCKLLHCLMKIRRDNGLYIYTLRKIIRALFDCNREKLKLIDEVFSTMKEERFNKTVDDINAVIDFENIMTSNVFDNCQNQETTIPVEQVSVLNDIVRGKELNNSAKIQTEISNSNVSNNCLSTLPSVASEIQNLNSELTTENNMEKNCMSEKSYTIKKNNSINNNVISVTSNQPVQMTQNSSTSVSEDEVTNATTEKNTVPEKKATIFKKNILLGKSIESLEKNLHKETEVSKTVTLNCNIQSNNIFLNSHTSAIDAKINSKSNTATNDSVSDVTVQSTGDILKNVLSSTLYILTSVNSLNVNESSCVTVPGKNVGMNVVTSTNSPVSSSLLKQVLPERNKLYINTVKKSAPVTVSKLQSNSTDTNHSIKNNISNVGGIPCNTASEQRNSTATANKINTPLLSVKPVERINKEIDLNVKFGPENGNTKSHDKNRSDSLQKSCCNSNKNIPNTVIQVQNNSVFNLRKDILSTNKLSNCIDLSNDLSVQPDPSVQPLKKVLEETNLHDENMSNNQLHQLEWCSSNIPKVKNQLDRQEQAADFNRSNSNNVTVVNVQTKSSVALKNYIKDKKVNSSLMSSHNNSYNSSSSRMDRKKSSVLITKDHRVLLNEKNKLNQPDVLSGSDIGLAASISIAHSSGDCGNGINTLPDPTAVAAGSNSATGTISDLTGHLENSCTLMSRKEISSNNNRKNMIARVLTAVDEVHNHELNKELTNIPNSINSCEQLNVESLIQNSSTDILMEKYVNSELTDPSSTRPKLIPINSECIINKFNEDNREPNKKNLVFYSVKNLNGKSNYTVSYEVNRLNNGEHVLAEGKSSKRVENNVESNLENSLVTSSKAVISDGCSVNESSVFTTPQTIMKKYSNQNKSTILTNVQKPLKHNLPVIVQRPTDHNYHKPNKICHVVPFQKSTLSDSLSVISDRSSEEDIQIPNKNLSNNDGGQIKDAGKFSSISPIITSVISLRGTDEANSSFKFIANSKNHSLANESLSKKQDNTVEIMFSAPQVSISSSNSSRNVDCNIINVTDKELSRDSTSITDFVHCTTKKGICDMATVNYFSHSNSSKNKDDCIKENEKSQTVVEIDDDDDIVVLQEIVYATDESSDKNSGNSLNSNKEVNSGQIIEAAGTSSNYDVKFVRQGGNGSSVVDMLLDQKGKCAHFRCKNYNQKITKGSQLLLCGGCNQRCYCTILCQVIDWYNGHRAVCAMNHKKQNK